MFWKNVVTLQKNKNINIFKESEVIMPKYGYNREKRIDAAIKRMLSSKKNAIKWMQDAGLVDANGQLAPMYR